MNAFSDRLLFLGGLGIVGISVILGIVYAAVYILSKHRLNAEFDAEYGEDRKK